MPSPRFMSLFLAGFLAAAMPVSGFAVVSSNAHRVSAIRSLSVTAALPTRSAAVHSFRYASMPRASAVAGCAATQEPEALATPSPQLQAADPSAKITVSFVIGTDGRVHSPLILESADSAEDRAVLNAIQSWKYRPARCNGVPMEAEGRIEFLSH